LSKIPVNVIIRQKNSTFFTEVYSLKNNKQPLFKKEEQSLLHAHQTVTSFIQSKYSVMRLNEIFEQKAEKTMNKKSSVSFGLLDPTSVNYQFTWAEFKNSVEQWIQIEFDCAVVFKIEKLPSDEENLLGNISISFDHTQTKASVIHLLLNHYLLHNNETNENEQSFEEYEETEELQLVLSILCDMFQCSNVKLHSDTNSKHMVVTIPFQHFLHLYTNKKRK